MFRTNAVFCRSVSGRGKPSQTANAHDDLGFYLPLYKGAAIMLWVTYWYISSCFDS